METAHSTFWSAEVNVSHSLCRSGTPTTRLGRTLIVGVLALCFVLLARSVGRTDNATGDTVRRPLLLGVSRTVIYPRTKISSSVAPQEPTTCQNLAPRTDTFDLTLTGANFSLAGPDNRILLKGNELNVCWKDVQPSGQCAADAIVGTVEQNGRAINLCGIPIAPNRGVASIVVDVGGDTSDAKTITISAWPQDVPKIAAVVVVTLIMVVLYYILSQDSSTIIAGKTQSRWTRIMLDSQTNTYSLAKFQFYIWTLVAVLGYIYLALAWQLIQGHFDFPDIPANLPGLLAISAGTTVVALGVGTAVGPKGAGSLDPGWSDLLTVGGVVVPERVQFVVWTVVGALTFLWAALAIDPASIQNLPGVPEQFLMLMGISSAGYLGGKLVRKSGPVVTEAPGLWEIQTPGQPQTKLIVNIIGQSLSRTPGIRFGEHAQLKVEYVTNDTKDPKDTDNLLEFVTKDEKATDDNLASQLRLTIKEKSLIEKIVQMQSQNPPLHPPVEAAKDQVAADIEAANAADPTIKPKISVTNPDGQMSEWRVRIKTKV